MAVYTLEKIASHIGGTVYGKSTMEIDGVSEIATANASQITFLANPKYKPLLETTSAGAVIIDGNADVEPEIPYIIAPNAYFGFLQAFLLFNPPQRLLEPGIHDTAVIEDTAEIGENVTICANCYIGAGVKVGDNSRILPNCVLLNNSEIGSDCLFYPSVSVREGCRIGKRVIIHNGAVIGSDGFGFAPWKGQYHKIPQVGTVIIEDDVEIGANVTIDRATLGETVIKAGVKLDNLVHIAHNVVVDEHTVMAAQAGISGSTKIGKHVMIGGQVGTVGHISIGEGAQIAAQSGVAKDVEPKEQLFGAPARPIMRAKRIEAVINNLPELAKRVKKLEKALEKLGDSDKE